MEKKVVTEAEQMEQTYYNCPEDYLVDYGLIVFSHSNKHIYPYLIVFLFAEELLVLYYLYHIVFIKYIINNLCIT